MSYEGDAALLCQIQPFYWKSVYAVAVSGVVWNPCGHMILNVGGETGWYFHVSEVLGYPFVLGAEGWKRYVKENQKTIWRRNRIMDLTDPNGAQRKLEELLAKRWFWGVLPHNCVNFVETVIRAGGSKAGLWTNCPAQEKWPQ